MTKTMAEYQRDHYQRRMKMARDRLGGKCIACGTTDDLDCHHIDPATKLFVVSTGYKRRLAEFLAEVDKCELLCHNCHVEGHGHGHMAHDGVSTAQYRRGCRCPLCSLAKSLENHEAYVERRDRGGT